MAFLKALPFLLLILAPGIYGQPANPIAVSGVVNYGRQTSSNGGYVSRDAGYEGNIGSTYFISYADTGKCTSPSLGSSCSYYAGNTLASSSYIPNSVNDYGSPPPLFCDSGSSNARLHISNISPLTSTTGAVWYTNISYSDSPCNEADGCPLTNGVAMVNYSNGPPKCSPLFPFWDVNSEPMWGTPVGPLKDGYIYMIGQLDPNVPGGNLSDVYLARVLNGSTFDYTKYPYWNGTAFSSTRLHDPVAVLPGGGAYDRPSILQNVSVLGSFTYNAYYNRYIVLAIASQNNIVAYTATLPQGPWSDATTIYTNTSYGGLSM